MKVQDHHQNGNSFINRQSNETIQDLQVVIQKLNNTLVQKDNTIDRLSMEVRTFHVNAASHCNETLKNLYTNLEYIASKDAATLSELSKSNIRRAQAAIQKLKLMTEDVITYSRIDELNSLPGPVNLENLLRDVVDSLNIKIQESGARIEIDKMPEIKGQLALLSLLFYNLIDNAIKFRKADQSPGIQIKCRQEEEINTISHALINTPYVIISISDNGVGFDPQYKEKIFEMFFRLPGITKYRGSGLGLSICSKIMQMHNGFITAESHPGIGTTFNCYFPMSAIS